MLEPCRELDNQDREAVAKMRATVEPQKGQRLTGSEAIAIIGVCDLLRAHHFDVSTTYIHRKPQFRYNKLDATLWRTIIQVLDSANWAACLELCFPVF